MADNIPGVSLLGVMEHVGVQYPFGHFLVPGCAVGEGDLEFAAYGIFNGGKLSWVDGEV